MGQGKGRTLAVLVAAVALGVGVAGAAAWWNLSSGRGVSGTPDPSSAGGQAGTAAAEKAPEPPPKSLEAPSREQYGKDLREFTSERYRTARLGEVPRGPGPHRFGGFPVAYVQRNTGLFKDWDLLMLEVHRELRRQKVLTTAEPLAILKDWDFTGDGDRKVDVEIAVPILSAEGVQPPLQVRDLAETEVFASAPLEGDRFDPEAGRRVLESAKGAGYTPDGTVILRLVMSRKTLQILVPARR